MQFSQALFLSILSTSSVQALPSLLRRQTSQCSTTYGCPFDITVAGCTAQQLVDGQLRVQNSSISEISDGQARCDLTGSTPVTFTLANGQVTDSSGRLCEISSQDQFQCSATPDAGSTTTGFSVCNNLLTFNSNSSFIACLATGEYPGYNIYTANVDRSTVTDCMPVQLDVPSCATSSSCVASTVTSTAAPVTVTIVSTQVQTTTVMTTQQVTITQTPVPATTVVQPTSTTATAAATCTNINAALGSTSFPLDIITVNSNTPSTVESSGYFAYVGNGNSTIFTFSPQSSTGQCSLNFYFPTLAEIQAQGGTTSYEISSGSIAVTLYELTSAVTGSTSYASKPARGAAYTGTLTPGQTTVFESMTCPAGQASYELVATDENTLSFFEDYNPPVLGLTVATCN